MNKIHLIVIGILMVLGVWLAPQDMENGDYQAEFYVDEVQVAYVSFSIGENLEKKTSTLAFSNFTLTLEYQEGYEETIGSRIWFKLTFHLNGSDASGLFSERVLCKIMGPNSFETNLVPSLNGSLEFSTRVLRFSSVILPLLLVVAYLWLKELIPLSAASLIVPLVIITFEIDTPTNALAPFFSKIIVLFLAGFLLAKAMQRVKLDEYISLFILSKVPANSNALMLVLMSLAAFFSMFMSNTAAAAVLIPLGLTILGKLHQDGNNYPKAVILGIAYAATVGGIGSMIGTPPNLMAIDFIEDYDGTKISFVEWFFFGLPVLVVMIPLIFLYLQWKYKPKVPKEVLVEARQNAIGKLKEAHSFSRDQWAVTLVFLSIAGLWLTEQFHGIHAGIVALAGTIVLFFTGQLQEEDINTINWNVLLTFGGGIALGTIVLKSGLAEWFSSLFIGFRGVPAPVVLLLIGTFALILTAFASNTASAAILIPIAMPLGQLFGINPITLAIYIAIVCSVDFAIVIGTPTTLLAYSTGMYKTEEIFRIGIVLDFIGLIISWMAVNLLFSWSFQFLFS